MNARMIFKIGDKVRFSMEALDMFPEYMSKKGVVVGFSRRGEELIRVRRYGLKNPDTWDINFWELQ